MKKVTSVLLGLVFMGLMFATPRATIVKVFWEPMTLYKTPQKDAAGIGIYSAHFPTTLSFIPNISFRLSSPLLEEPAPKVPCEGFVSFPEYSCMLNDPLNPCYACTNWCYVGSQWKCLGESYCVAAYYCEGE